MISSRIVAAATAALLAAALTACGTAAPTSTGSPAPTSAGATSSATAPAAGTVSANDASEDELTAALEAAGVTNAGRWAGEIVEYRPYDAGDTGFAALREELAKYNPDDATLEKIISVLEP